MKNVLHPVESYRNRRVRFKDRARAEYLIGAEEEWHNRTGRPMTTAELEGALRQYPGDLDRSPSHRASCAGLKWTPRLQSRGLSL
jgi:hypothetical protein